MTQKPWPRTGTILAEEALARVPGNPRAAVARDLFVALMSGIGGCHVSLQTAGKLAVALALIIDREPDSEQNLTGAEILSHQDMWKVKLHEDPEHAQFVHKWGADVTGVMEEHIHATIATIFHALREQSIPPLAFVLLADAGAEISVQEVGWMIDAKGMQ